MSEGACRDAKHAAEFEMSLERVWEICAGIKNDVVRDTA